MLIRRFTLRSLVFAVAGTSFLSMLLVSNSASPATEARQSQHAALPNEPRSSNVSAAAASMIPSVANQTGDEAVCDYLPEDHALRPKLNGRRLSLDYVGLETGSEKSLLKGAKVLPISDGRFLVGLGDTLYMLDQKKRVEWKYKPSWIIWDFAFIESNGLVYGGAGDGVMFIVDGSTGKPLYSHFQNGKADHLQVVPFGEDMCLITNSMAGYRDALDEWRIGRIDMIETDVITAWRGTDAVWSMDFPPDADVVVRGDRIYAVTKTDKSIYVREISPPNADGKQQ